MATKGKSLTLQDIFSYLLNSKKDKLLNQNEIQCSSDFPEDFKQIFNDKIYRYGSVHLDEYTPRKRRDTEKQDISFYYSLFFCLKDDFVSIELADQMTFIDKFKYKLITDFKTERLFKEMKYKDMGWEEGPLINSINENITSSITIQMISDYFDLNIFILDFNDEKIYVFYHENVFNKYKSNIFLTHVKQSYEPVFYYDNSKIFNYDNPIFSKLISQYNHEIIPVSLDLNGINKDFLLVPPQKDSDSDSDNDKNNIIDDLYQNNDTNNDTDLDVFENQKMLEESSESSSSEKEITAKKKKNKKETKDKSKSKSKSKSKTDNDKKKNLKKD